MMRKPALAVKTFIPLKAFSNTTCLALAHSKNKVQVLTNDYTLHY